MDDTTRDTTPDATYRATPHDVVPVAEAAVALGITEDAVRARLRRGSLTGEKRGTVWVVDREALISAMQGDTTRRDVTRPHDTTSRDATGDVARHDRMPTVDQNALTEQLRSEVAYLREKLDQSLAEAERLRQQAAAERERADVLQREALGRIETLSATVRNEADDQVPAARPKDATSPAGILARLRRFLRGS